MTSNTLHCHLCQAVLVDNESTIKQHISSFHLNYRPYYCRTCNEEGDSFKAATEERMDAHIAISHSSTNSGYLVVKDQMKETDLKAAIEECRRMSTLQLSPADTTVDWHQTPALNSPADIDENVQVERDSKEHLRRVFISLGGTSTDAGNSSTEMEQENPEVNF
ncbi:hypothetical protein DdX_22406 [Ditylenchus destructor]|uniref:Uncharacterized protein n=1 Tax=Ditylenchus destructor TaxID=166010 RepID=A0AAD4QUH6_9BILA|nr:hypothetical protein DdX_22406 [Ditylenchus destructor]